MGRRDRAQVDSGQVSAAGTSAQRTLRIPRVPTDVGSGALIIGSLVGLIAAVFGLAGVVALFGVIAAVLGVVLWPGVVFAAYLLLPFYKGFVNPYVPVDLTVVLAVLNGMQLIWVALGGWRHIRREPVILWLALTLVIVAGAAYAPSQGEAVPLVAEWVALIVFPSCAALRIASGSGHVRQVIFAIFAMGLLVILLGVPRIGGEARVVVLQMNTIQVAVAALFVPIIAVAVARGTAWGVAILALVPLSIVVAVGTGSRGPLLAATGVALGVGVLHLARGGGVDRRAAGVVAVLGIGAAIAFAAVGRLPDASIARYLTLAEIVSAPAGAAGGSSVGVRSDLFGAALRIFLERPLLGNGTGAFAFHAGGTVGLTDLPYPHNILLHAAADLGLVGLALVSVLVISALLRRLPPGRPWMAVRLTFAFLFLESLVSGDLYSERMLWGLLALLVFAPVTSGSWLGQERGG